MIKHYSIVLARKPLSEKSIVENVLKHGTGGLNIDGSRIKGIKPQVSRSASMFQSRHDGRLSDDSSVGRFPANLMFDEEAAKVLDEQSGISKSSKHKWTGDNNAPIYGKYDKGIREATYDDKGGASRFFFKVKEDE